jgi:ribosomal protein S25
MNNCKTVSESTVEEVKKKVAQENKFTPFSLICKTGSTKEPARYYQVLKKVSEEGKLSGNTIRSQTSS